MKLNWDPEIDTPATIAVIGGGPIGVEAALYARFLGYSVMLFDAKKVGHRQLAWGDRQMDAAWGEVTSSLGLAALAAQGSAENLPQPDARVSFKEYVNKYLLRVARTDLLYDAVQINSEVLSISRTGCSADAAVSEERRAEQEFRLLIHSAQRGEYSQLADIVLDCSGLAPRSGLASGGGLAVGERTHLTETHVGKVDVLGKHRGAFAGKHTLLFGNDELACGNAIDLARLATEAVETRVTWVLAKQIGAAEKSLNFPSGVPDELVKSAEVLCEPNLSPSGKPSIVVVPAWGIERLQHADETWAVRLQTGEEETLEMRCDAVINCHRQIRDWSFGSDLRLAGHDQLSTSMGTQTAEPHYYVLGKKAVGDRTVCTIQAGLDQIRGVFTKIGGREDLDLYETIRLHNA